MNVTDESCAVCCHIVAVGEAEVEIKEAGVIRRRPVRSMTRALGQQAEDKRILDPHGNVLPLHAQTIAGGTLVCGLHVSHCMRPA